MIYTRRIEISWTDHVRNEEVLLKVNKQKNILHEIRKRKANWIGYILRRNCLLKQVIERKIKGEMEVAIRRGWRRKKLLDDLKDRRGYSHLNEEGLDRTMWRNRFGGGFGPVVRQNTEWMNIPVSRYAGKSSRQKVQNDTFRGTIDIPYGKQMKQNWFYVFLVWWPCISVQFVLIANFTHFFNVFISLLFMFRATQCSSSGESIVSIHHLV